MEVAHIPCQSRHYRLPASAMTPLSLPHVAQAMRVARATLFSRDKAGVVDLRAHSMLCREALESGLLDDGSAEWLRQYPNSYGLYRLTGELVTRLGRSFVIDGEGLFPHRDRLLQRLETRYVDPVETASYALAAIDAGLVTVDTLTPHITAGPEGAGKILKVIEDTLSNRIKLPDALGKPYSYGIQDGHFCLESNWFASFELNVPKSLELRVLLFKTLDAMTRFLLPFHTPMTFLGPYSYFNHGLAEIYEEMAERLEAQSGEELCMYLQDESANHSEYVEEYLMCNGSDEDSVHLLLDSLYEMDELKRIAGATLAVGDRAEVEALLDEATQICERDDATTPFASVLRYALEKCLEHEATGLLSDFHPSNFPGTADDGVTLFESIRVDLTRDFPNLKQSSEEGFDSIVSGTGFPAMGLPLSPDQLQTVTLPVLDALSVTLDLLQRITDASEGCGNAE